MRRRAVVIMATGVLTALAPATALAVDAEKIYGITDADTLVSFSTDAPGVFLSGPTQVTGLTGSIVGIDVQPRTGRLLAVTDASRVYSIDRATAAATPLGAAPFTPAVNGTGFGVDVNPVPDAIRLLSSGGAFASSLRLSPADGTTLGVDTAPSGAVAAAAYSANVDGASATTLYALDSDNDRLVRVGGLGGAPSPNLGATTSVGALGVNVNPASGLDISGASGVAYAALQLTANVASLHRIDLASGVASAGVPIGPSVTDLVDIAVEAPPPAVRFADAAPAAAEDEGTATVRVIRSGDTSGSSSAVLSTSTAGSATAGGDFTAVSAQPVVFGPGETAKDVPITLSDDNAVESPETIGVTLGPPISAGTSLSAPNRALVTVYDDDPEQVTTTTTVTTTVTGPTTTVTTPGETTTVPGPVTTVTTPGPATTTTVPGPTVTVAGPPAPPRAADQVLLLAAPQAIARAALTRSGVRLRASCAEACTIAVALRLGTRTLGTGTARLTGRGRATVTVRLTAAGTRALAAAFAPRGARTRRLTLAGTATDADGGATAKDSAALVVSR